jgi:hypothetical protein
MVLHSGLEIKAWSISANDMQLIVDAAIPDRGNLPRLWRAAVHGRPLREKYAWGAGVESMGKGFRPLHAAPVPHKFEVELNRKLFRTAARASEFDTADLERADYAALMTALRAGVGRAGEPRIMSVNEARAVLRLKKDPSGNELGINPGKAAPDPATNQKRRQAMKNAGCSTCFPPTPSAAASRPRPTSSSSMT